MARNRRGHPGFGTHPSSSPHPARGRDGRFLPLDGRSKHPGKAKSPTLAEKNLTSPASGLMLGEVIRGQDGRSYTVTSTWWDGSRTLRSGSIIATVKGSARVNRISDNPMRRWLS